MGRYLDLAKAVETADFCGKGAVTHQFGEIITNRAGDTSFESDRECEKSEKSEKRSGVESCEKSEKRSATDIVACPPGGRAVLLQVPNGVPVEWAQGVADLLAMPPHPDWQEPRWKALQEDALVFLQDWAAQAHALGWDALNLFGVHAAVPRARLDGMGLVPLLEGRAVVALTAATAAIAAASGGTLTYRRRKTWPPGCCLIWDLERAGSP
jgi:hypothetical protein